MSNFTTFSDHAFSHVQLNLLNTMQNSVKYSDAAEIEERQVNYQWKDQFKEQCIECIRVNMYNIICFQD